MTLIRREQFHFEDIAGAQFGSLRHSLELSTLFRAHRPSAQPLDIARGQSQYVFRFMMHFQMPAYSTNEEVL